MIHSNGFSSRKTDPFGFPTSHNIQCKKNTEYHVVDVRTFSAEIKRLKKKKKKKNVTSNSVSISL